MPPNLRTFDRSALPWVLTLLAAWPVIGSAQMGNRVLFPEKPMPVYNTHSPNAWASSNLTSVPLSAGGSAVVFPNAAGPARYPANHPPSPTQLSYALAYSSFGHVTTGNRPDYYLGDQILAPTNVVPAGWYVNWFAMGSAIIGKGAIFSPSVQQVYATAGGVVSIDWVFTDGQTNQTITQTYVIGGTPSRRPFRIYWTEQGYGAPTVDLQGQHVRFHWNTDIPAPVHDADGNLVRGLEIDSLGQLHAAPGPDPTNAPLQGMVVMQYFKTGDYTDQVPGGAIVVEVRRPEVNTLSGEVGKRLLPKANPYGYHGLDARVTRGAQSGDTSSAYVYQHQGQYTHSPKNGWVFAIRPTVTNLADPEEGAQAVEIYWQEPDLMGTLWPYEVDWYAVNWPTDAQRYVRDPGGSPAPKVLVPMALGPQLENAQDPAGHATLTTDGVFSTTREGYSLLRFTANDNVWFQVVHSIHSTNQMFGGDPFRWPVGTQLQPALSLESLSFNGSSSRATAMTFPAMQTNEFTVECWLAVSYANDGRLKPVLSRNLGTNAWDFLLAVNGAGYLSARIGQTDLTGPALENDKWYHAALAVSNDTATIFLDGVPSSTYLPAGDWQPTASPLRVGWAQSGENNWFFSGQLDEVRIWSKALAAQEVSLARNHSLTGDVLTNLLTWYPIESDGAGFTLLDIKSGHSATFENAVFVRPGATVFSETDGFSAFHGYIHDPSDQAPYNVNLYRYPTTDAPDAETCIFGVNATRPLEVWWAQRVQQTDMPEPVYFPAWACAYQPVWATNNAPEIVLASGQGSPAFESADTPSIYVQNTNSLPGYNPNEEHALMGQDRGGWVAYALRDDLNTAASSPPFVLVDYTDRDSERPLMQVFRVVRTNATYTNFACAALVGDPLVGPRPLDLLPNVEPTAATKPQGWRDRNLTWWAVGAGSGANTAEIMVTNYYPMQLGFWFPALLPHHQPAAGTPIPWLPLVPDLAQPTNGTPLAVTWTVSWPDDVPTMKVGQTLTRATGGLPDIWEQASVEVACQQSAMDHPDADPPATSVILFDPTVARDVAFTNKLEEFGFTVGAGGNSYLRHGMTWFQGLPPDLGDRFYYDPTRKALRFVGRLVEPATGSPWLHVNILSATQRAELKSICSLSGAKKTTWDAAIDELAASGIKEVGPDDPFDHLALAAVGRGSGCVTLAFNNSTNADSGLPILVQVIKVVPELYTGFLIPLTDQWNLLSEQMNILFSASFAGAADSFEFQWVAVDPPTDGTVPPLPSGNPSLTFAQEDGLTRIRIGGQGATLQDLVNRFFTVRYRAADPAVQTVVGTGWSDYTDYALAEGWVQRVMFSITPFEQRLLDLYNNPVETRVSMVQQAGKPYAGDLALTMDAVNDVGLIELYQTVFNRAQRLSLDLGINSPAVNQQLLLAVSRLQALYMLLGNEAYADALDPTIGFGSQTVINNAAVLPVDYGSFSSSLFCFANQVPTLLDEELALLRGRGTPGLAPGVGNFPYYNRLLWNFTRGIDAGEVAYAVNYNIHSSSDVTISEETAAGLYPQGHGDAYGHYLNALKGYYHLLRNPHFSWGDPSITALLLGYQTISADFDDETRFADASAALARTGVEIARRASRKAYTESADSAYTNRVDTDTARAWGVDEWIGRTGMGAFYNWAVSQSLLPTSRVDVAVEGDITRIDRSSVKAVREIATQYAALQHELDQLDQGFNPLGLARGAVPFDISPAEIDAGKTHFDQVYARAVGTLANAQTTFDSVQETVRLLRQQSESALQFEEAVADQETDYNNRLIEIFGYPYADDIGPDGAYVQGYDGPDLYHFMYMDLVALGFAKSTDIGTITVKTNALSPESITADSGLNYASTNLTFHVAANGLVAKPQSWTGERRAEGEIQRAYRQFLVSLLELRAATLQYQNDIEQLNAEFTWYQSSWSTMASNELYSIGLNNQKGAVRAWTSLGANSLESVCNWFIQTAQIYNQDAEAGWAILFGILGVASDIYGQVVDTLVHTDNLKIDSLIATNTFRVQDYEIQSAIRDLAREQNEAAAALQVALQKASDAQAGFTSAIAEGERLLDERESFRTSASSRIAASRYNDMAFRVFRNDALRRYSDAFELAARYTYLAAKAYDYETGLLPSDTTQDPGSEFMNEIIRARTLGRVANGQPVLGVTSIGEPGLADILARMSANWSVLRGRLGFNNPETETGRFSLRTELFRIAPGHEGDALWRQKLQMHKVDDLFVCEDFRRSCLPFASQSGLEEREPGIVIPFSSTVDFAKNFLAATWPAATMLTTLHTSPPRSGALASGSPITKALPTVPRVFSWPTSRASISSPWAATSCALRPVWVARCASGKCWTRPSPYRSRSAAMTWIRPTGSPCTTH